ncbi:hypothetical protein ACIQVR_41795 [Streptomyces xanthochromogenes]|uniref:hypothetical protein n=1 Tax=Streptomyces xanthochromogenes TaxID=67384 RepID=UPI00382B142A
MSAPDRLAILRQAVREHPGPWTTRTVQTLYKTHGHNAPHRKTARDDLALLARQGLLLCRDERDCRSYWLNTWQEAAR